MVNAMGAQAADPNGHADPGASPHKGGTQNRFTASPQDVVLAAATLSLSLSAGRSRYEVETLINLLSLTTSNLQAVLAQMLIADRYDTELEVPL